MNKKTKIQYIGYVCVNRKKHKQEELFILKFLTPNRDEMQQSLNRFKSSCANTDLEIVETWIEKANEEEEDYDR